MQTSERMTPPVDPDHQSSPQASGPPAQPLLLTLEEAAQLCRCSVRSWRAWDASARVPRALQIGRAKLWRYAELAAWVEAGCPERSLWTWLA